MYLLTIVLKDESTVRKVVSSMLELEIYDATVVDSEGIENLAVRTVPQFEEVGVLFGQSLAYQRTILARVPDRQRVDHLVGLCRREGMDLTDPTVATLLLVPCETYEGPAA